MTQLVKTLLFVTATLAGVVTIAVADEPTRRDSIAKNNESVEGFVNLLAGGDLKKHFETTGNWSLNEDGVVHLQPREGEIDWKRYGDYLWLKHQYKDFECEFEYKHEKGGNSGFYFNVTDRQKAVGPVIEIQIIDSAGESELSAHGICGGILPGITPTANTAKPAGQWNKMVVLSLNGLINVKLNGMLVNRAKLTHPRLKTKPKQGFIGFQDHGIPFWLRNVRIRKLSSSKKPLNVIMIEADDLNPMALGYMGHRVVQTPHLDRLAAQGTVFKNCIVQGTACAPSRNSLITGSYPHNTGIYMNASSAGLPENGWTFPAALRRAGVYTALYGKNHFRPFGIDPRESYDEQNLVIRNQLGFDHAFSMGGKVALSARKHPPEKDPYSKHLHDKGIYDKLVTAYTKKRRGIDIDFPLDEEDYVDSFIINSAIKWLGGQEERQDPFFLWIDLTLPHPPMDVPQKYKDLYKDVDLDPVIPARKTGLPASLANDMDLNQRDSTEYRRGYLAMITMMDALVGRLVDHLDKSGLRENTIVIFVADQGSMTGHHGLYSKKYFYKEVINSPTIISHPMYGKGKVITRPVELLDISKTMVTLYGGSQEDIASSHGFDLMPLLQGGSYEREFAHAEQHGVNMIQNKDFKLVSYEDGDILYDLKNDPDEMTNAISQHPDIAKMLRKKKEHWLTHSGELKPSLLKPEKGTVRRGAVAR